MNEGARRAMLRYFGMVPKVPKGAEVLSPKGEHAGERLKGAPSGARGAEVPKGADSPVGGSAPKFGTPPTLDPPGAIEASEPWVNAYSGPRRKTDSLVRGRLFPGKNARVRPGLWG
jgi:hypothetical protein